MLLVTDDKYLMLSASEASGFGLRSAVLDVLIMCQEVLQMNKDICQKFFGAIYLLEEMEEWKTEAWVEKRETSLSFHVLWHYVTCLLRKSRIVINLQPTTATKGNGQDSISD